MSDGPALRLPLHIETGESGTTTLLVDASGVAIGGCYGKWHGEHAKALADLANAATITVHMREHLN
jgi:hypothetical protein